MTNLSRFRVGAWQLKVNDHKFKSIGRIDRVCDYCKNTCGINECEDEKHVVFKCRLYDTCGAKHARLFFTANNLKEFLENKDKKALANCVVLLLSFLAGWQAAMGVHLPKLRYYTVAALGVGVIPLWIP